VTQSARAVQSRTHWRSRYGSPGGSAWTASSFGTRPIWRESRGHSGIATTGHRVHRALAGLTPVQHGGALRPAPAALDHYGWQQHCRGLFELPIAA